MGPPQHSLEPWVKHGRASGVGMLLLLLAQLQCWAQASGQVRFPQDVVSPVVDPSQGWAKNEQLLAQQGVPGWGSQEQRFMRRDGLLSEEYLTAAPHSHAAAHSPKRRKLQALMSSYFCRLIPTAPVALGNLLRNPLFRNTSAGWDGNGATLQFRIGLNGHSYGVISNRDGTYNGPAQSLTNLRPGHYQFSIWLKLSGGAGQYVRAKFKSETGAYQCIGAAIAKSHCWTKLMGGFVLSHAESTARIYVEGATTNVAMYASSASLYVVDQTSWRQGQNTRISKLRMRPVVLRLQTRSGAPLQGVNVVVDQIKSDFPFGAATNGGILYDKKYQKWFLSRFNWAVYTNEAKWYCTEAQEGAFNYALVAKMNNFFRSNGVKIRGHNLFWNVQAYVQKWVQALDNRTLWQRMQIHAQSEVTAFKGQFAHWDVLNEPLHGDYYNRRLSDRVLPWMFKAAHQYDPTAQLFVNDFNTVETCDGVSHPEYYLANVWNWKYLQNAPVGGIGVESHFQGEPQAVKVRNDLNQLSVAGIPIWITELDFSPDLPIAVQANYFETYMREAFSHPGVQGIVLWRVAFIKCSIYRDPDASVCNSTCKNCLCDENYNDNALGQRYVRLRKEWSTHFANVTPADSTFRFRGFHGTYRVKAQINGTEYIRFFRVPVGSTPISVVVTF